MALKLEILAAMQGVGSGPWKRHEDEASRQTFIVDEFTSLTILIIPWGQPNDPPVVTSIRGNAHRIANYIALCSPSSLRDAFYEE